MTGLEAKEYIGRQGSLKVEKQLGILVNILDAREAYGRIDLQVEPVSGTGKVWVSTGRIVLLGTGEVTV